MPPYTPNPLDQEVNTELMRVCKCVIPYLDHGTQKNVAIGLKFLELVNTINTYSNTMNLSRSLTLERQGNWESELLRNVKSNLSPEKAYIIDALIKLQEFRSILNIKEAMASSTASSPPPVFTDAPQPSPSKNASSTNRQRKPHQKKVFKPDSKPSFNSEKSFEPELDAEPTEPTNYTTPNPAQLLQALSPMLDDKQRQMLTMFSALMNNTNK